MSHEVQLYHYHQQGTRTVAGFNLTSPYFSHVQLYVGYSYQLLRDLNCYIPGVLIVEKYEYVMLVQLNRYISKAIENLVVNAEFYLKAN